MKLGIIARADLTGLGVQSRNWVRLLDPHKTIVINSRVFNNNEQHFEWYRRPNAYKVDGFIKPMELGPILSGIDAILTFEIPYNYDVIRLARVRGVKTILHNNWEFTDYLRQPNLPLPDLLINHSYWHLDDQKKLWPDITDYCPTPIFIEDFDSILAENKSRDLTKRRFLHVAGRRTYEDRNGTQDLLAAMRLIPAEYNFELVIKAQNADVGPTTDPRIVVDRTSPIDEKELYRDFDAMIMPRRYGGACLPMTEALASGMPVIMTNIDPNDKVLPGDWLVSVNHSGSFMTRTMIDVFSANHNALADKIVDLVVMPDEELIAQKTLAREIAVKEYSSQSVKEKWALLMSKIGL